MYPGGLEADRLISIPGRAPNYDGYLNTAPVGSFSG